VTLSTRQRAFALAAARALGPEAARFCETGGAGLPMAMATALSGHAAALVDSAAQAHETEALARPQPSGLERVDPSWYVAPPRAVGDEAAVHLQRAAYGRLVSMSDARTKGEADAGAGALSSRTADEIERALVALGRRRVALAFVGAPRAGLAQLCARLGEPTASQLVDEVRGLEAAATPGHEVKAAQRAVYFCLGRSDVVVESGRALLFRVGAAWLAPALARDGDELMRAAQRLPRARGQTLLEEADGVSSESERSAALSLLANASLATL
jgi:hypothetical protein